MEQQIRPEDFKKVEEVTKAYYKQLHYIEDVNLWSGMKYDNKCYPNQILIKQYAEKLI